jgi:hypothetical protein
MAYIGTSPSNGVRRRFVYEATASQTSFSGSDENGVTLTYVDSLYLDVFQNGIKLKAGDDYTATTGTTVVLVQGASANDVVEMVAFDIFSVGDTVSAKDGGNLQVMWQWQVLLVLQETQQSVVLLVLQVILL